VFHTLLICPERIFFLLVLQITDFILFNSKGIEMSKVIIKRGKWLNSVPNEYKKASNFLKALCLLVAGIGLEPAAYGYKLIPCEILNAFTRLSGYRLLIC